MKTVFWLVKWFNSSYICAFGTLAQQKIVRQCDFMTNKLKNVCNLWAETSQDLSNEYTFICFDSKNVPAVALRCMETEQCKRDLDRVFIVIVILCLRNNNSMCAVKWCIRFGFGARSAVVWHQPFHQIIHLTFDHTLIFMAYKSICPQQSAALNYRWRGIQYSQAETASLFRYNLSLAFPSAFAFLFLVQHSVRPSVRCVQLAIRIVVVSTTVWTKPLAQKSTDRNRHSSLNEKRKKRNISRRQKISDHLGARVFGSLLFCSSGLFGADAQTTVQSIWPRLCLFAVNVILRDPIAHTQSIISFIPFFVVLL